MRLLGSTGCQPVLFGSLPKSSSNVLYAQFLSGVDSRRQAADDNRLAACAPQIRGTSPSYNLCDLRCLELLSFMQTEISIPDAEDLKSRIRELRRFL